MTDDFAGRFVLHQRGNALHVLDLELDLFAAPVDPVEAGFKLTYGGHEIVVNTMDDIIPAFEAYYAFKRQERVKKQERAT